MTFYQELQLGQAGSKNLIRACETPRDRLLHTLIYLFKIALTVGFCFCFVTLYSMAFGSANSIVGVVVLLYLLVFRISGSPPPCLHHSSYSPRQRLISHISQVRFPAFSSISRLSPS